ncbi:hypothetical protein HYC85_011410 [Camellia sinensis]|uniref:tryptophan synthase n=1 Tax=Camellia sinensis TaxID=4442 RepID=A0A7J7HA56_CAMSI|nr:hypothetical protein HYC85_011410 [Camellia sinensis]
MSEGNNTVAKMHMALARRFLFRFSELVFDFRSVIFRSREALIKWASDVEKKTKFVIIIMTLDARDNGKKLRLTLACKRSGYYKENRKIKGEQLKLTDSKKLIKAVHSGTATLKDATSGAIRDCVTNVESTHYILGSVAGPHLYPMMVREFHAVIGKETRKQALEKWGGKPNILFACVGGGSNAMGLFHEFVDDEDVRLIGVEPVGFGLDSGKHAATLTKGEVGVLHGAMSYLLQDEDGQIVEPHSISAGLDCPGVGPEQSFLKDIGHAEYYSIMDKEALEALETSHALAYLEKLCPTLSNGTKVVFNCSGRGDQDVQTAIKYLQVE